MTFFAPTAADERTTCSTRGRPPAACRTLAMLDLSRVPLPAARIRMATSLLFGMGALSRGGGFLTTARASLPGAASNNLVRSACGNECSDRTCFGPQTSICGGDGPGARVRQQAADQLRVQGMAGLAGFDASQQRQSDQRQI